MINESGLLVLTFLYLSRHVFTRIFHYGVRHPLKPKIAKKKQTPFTK